MSKVRPQSQGWLECMVLHSEPSWGRMPKAAGKEGRGFSSVYRHRV